MTLYMNNSGSRWIDTDKRAMEFVLVLPDGTHKPRRADYFESFGNFAVLAYRYKGKRHVGMPKCHDGSETRVAGEDPRTFIFHANSRGFTV